MHLFNYVTVIPNCISKELIQVFLSLRYEDISSALTGYSDNQKPNLDYRVTNWIALPSNIIQNTTNAIEQLYNNQLIHKYKQQIKNIESPQFLYYNVGGKYDLHNDSEDFINGTLERVCERDVTILLYLNDDYEGGELELPDWGCKFKPKAGTLIAFPSYIDFSHRVHPVTSGQRYNLVSWICTNDRIYERPYNGLTSYTKTDYEYDTSEPSIHQ
jgi:predicted 2-oxoglutarate/Fe(II)-dependent dioxygenase YbiX